VDLSHVFSLRRWKARFRGDDPEPQRDYRHAPDATVDEVGGAPDNVGFHGRPLRSRDGNGQGSGDPSSSGWSGWSGGA
jgi:hypothetical protein